LKRETGRPTDNRNWNSAQRGYETTLVESNETCAEVRAEEAYTDGENHAVKNPNGIYVAGCNEELSRE
jgi:hypothetical protein